MKRYRNIISACGSNLNALLTAVQHIDVTVQAGTPMTVTGNGTLTVATRQGVPFKRHVGSTASVIIFRPKISPGGLTPCVNWGGQPSSTRGTNPQLPA